MIQPTNLSSTKPIKQFLCHRLQDIDFWSLWRENLHQLIILSYRFGGKHVLGIGMFVSIVTTLLIPVAARTHPYMVIGLRVIMGIAMVFSSVF